MDLVDAIRYLVLPPHFHCSQAFKHIPQQIPSAAAPRTSKLLARPTRPTNSVPLSLQRWVPLEAVSAPLWTVSTLSDSLLRQGLESLTLPLFAFLRNSHRKLLHGRREYRVLSRIPPNVSLTPLSPFTQIRGIGAVLSAIVGGIASALNATISCLTCSGGRGGGRRRRAAI